MRGAVRTMASSSKAHASIPVVSRRASSSAESNLARAHAQFAASFADIFSAVSLAVSHSARTVAAGASGTSARVLILAHAAKAPAASAGFRFRLGFRIGSAPFEAVAKQVSRAYSASTAEWMGSPRSIPFVGGSKPRGAISAYAQSAFIAPWPVISPAHRVIAGCSAAVASRSAAVAAATMISISHVVSPLTSPPPNRGVRHPRRVVALSADPPVEVAVPVGFDSREDVTALLPSPAPPLAPASTTARVTPSFASAVAMPATSRAPAPNANP
mmetsp:Transcript_1119/g.4200  ORF Transcript_1119/g.4200 Transcript_1119/m.4200 type:complete len:272 (+) Transcript_1119:1752-2567(+)